MDVIHSLVKNEKEHAKLSLGEMIRTAEEKDAQQSKFLFELIENQDLIPPHLKSINADGPDFKYIESFKPKKGGVNPGVDVVVGGIGIRRKLTVKQGRTFGNTLAESITPDVTSKMPGVEHETPSDEKKSGLKKTVIARAHLVLRESVAPSSIPARACDEGLWVASEWSQDQASYEACQLFGLQGRVRMAGTYMGRMFAAMRYLNNECQLGLESVIIAAIFTADFDLHTENFMLKINTSRAPQNESAKQEIAELLKKLDSLMKEPTEDYIGRAEHLIGIIHVLQKNYKVDVYFHKIDHDSGFYRYADPERKVDLSSHYSSPIAISARGIHTQPTLHISELLVDEKNEGIDQLLLSRDAITILQKNPFHAQLNTILEAAEKLFENIHEAASQMRGLTAEGVNKAEYILLKEFNFHLSQENVTLLDDKPIESQIEEMKKRIRHSFLIGTIYKVNDLHSQLYNRLSAKEEKKPLSVEEEKFKEFVILQIKKCQAEYLSCCWGDILNKYRNRFFATRPSEADSQLLQEISESFLGNDADREIRKMEALTLLQKYLKPNSGSDLGKIILDIMVPVRQIDITTPALQQKDSELRELWSPSSLEGKP